MVCSASRAGEICVSVSYAIRGDARGCNELAHCFARRLPHRRHPREKFRAAHRQEFGARLPKTLRVADELDELEPTNHQYIGALFL
jgi:hypothetical protein